MSPYSPSLVPFFLLLHTVHRVLCTVSLLYSLLHIYFFFFFFFYYCNIIINFDDWLVSWWCCRGGWAIFRPGIPPPSFTLFFFFFYIYSFIYLFKPSSSSSPSSSLSPFPSLSKGRKEGKERSHTCSCASASAQYTQGYTRVRLAADRRKITVTAADALTLVFHRPTTFDYIR